MCDVREAITEVQEGLGRSLLDKASSTLQCTEGLEIGKEQLRQIRSNQIRSVKDLLLISETLLLFRGDYKNVFEKVKKNISSSIF